MSGGVSNTNGGAAGPLPVVSVGDVDDALTSACGNCSKVGFNRKLENVEIARPKHAVHFQPGYILLLRSTSCGAPNRCVQLFFFFFQEV